MLYLIGLGLYDEKDITQRGINAIKNCDNLYIEIYTSKWNGLESLRMMLGKEIIEVKRSDLEENQKKILDEAKSKKVGVLIPGDPLVATTHIDLLIQAKKNGIKTVVIHAPSIYSAVAETGLFIYKFGKTTTIPFVQEGYKPESPYDTIKQNRENVLHTLCLLDIKDRLMAPSEGLKYLLEIEGRKKEMVISEDDEVIVFSMRERSFIIYDKVNNILNRDFPTPAVLIIPGELHSIEKEALSCWKTT